MSVIHLYQKQKRIDFFPEMHYTFQTQHKKEEHYEKKMSSSKKKLKKFNTSLRQEKCSDKEDVKAKKTKLHQCTKTRRTVKLPRLKLEDLVAQVREENAHGEISTGPAVGNEVW